MEYPLIMIIKLSTLQQMLLEYLTSEGNYCRNLECCQISPTDKPLTMNSHLETKHYLVSETFKDHAKLCVKDGNCVNIVKVVFCCCHCVFFVLFCFCVFGLGFLVYRFGETVVVLICCLRKM